MTDLPDSAADRAADASTPDVVATGGDPEPAGLGPREASPDERTLAAEEPTEVIPAAASQPSEPGVTAVPTLPVAPAATEGDPLAPRRRRPVLAGRFGISFVLGFVLAVGFGVGVLYGWGQQYDGRILPGVRIGATEVGGLTPEQATAKIANAYRSLGSGQVTLTGPDGKTTVSYADLGRGPDTSALLDAALAVGRQGEPLANAIDEARAAFRGVTIDPAVAYDQSRLAAVVANLAGSIDQPPTDASVSVGQGGSFTVSPAKVGRAVDKTALLTTLDQKLGALGTPGSIAIAVPMVALTPAVTTASAETAKAVADRMAADIVVTLGTDNRMIARATLAPLISFSTAADGSLTPILDEPGLDPILATLAQTVNQTVQDAGLKLVSGHVVATGASREGRTLDVAGTKAAIITEILTRETGRPASPVAAVAKVVEPSLTTADAASFAPNMRAISSFSIYYWVLINNHWGGNIEAPATKIDGTVVPAGGIFDFWKVVGDLHKLPGTGPGNAIEGGTITVTGAFGGGICTTSTTLFNAAFRAGMIPLARQPHGEFIDRYPPGLDATVWIVGNTKQTMSFKNDTAYPILIQRTITDAGSKRWLTFTIWSVPNGRTYQISNLVMQPGAKAINTVVKDPTKPVGYTYQNNIAVNGEKVWVTVTIYDHGQVHWTKRYYSNYPPVNGVTIVGTG